MTAAFCAVAAIRASAQDAEIDPAQTARFRLGPLRFTPSIVLTNLGVDSNVFNEFADPKRDTVGAAGPAVDLWLRAGRSQLSGRVSAEYLFFQKYRSERALNTADTLKWELPMASITPFVIGSYADVKNRSTYEIDVRTRHQDVIATVGAELRLSSRSSFIVSAGRARVRLAAGQIFDGTDLATALNRRTDAAHVQFRHKLTSLTTFVVKSEGVRDRFEFAALRNANSISVLPGFEMRPSALISGTAFVGFRTFGPLDAAVPASNGLVAAVDARYIMRATQFQVKVNRDFAYSYQGLRPYYLLNDISLAITQRLSRTWDVLGRAGRQTLAYKAIDRFPLPKPGNFALVPLPIPTGVVDRTQQYGAGIGYRVGRTLRLGLDGMYYRRRSEDLVRHDFEGMRYGLTVSYGTPQ